MTWFRVDDSFGTHPKVMAIPRAKRKSVVGLWSLAGSWCAQQLTDGAFAAYMLDEWAGTRTEAQLLVDVGLWERTDEGYVFHDWTDWNPSREQVLTKRKADAARQQRGRDRQRRNRGEPAVTPQLSSVSRRDTPRDTEESCGTSHGGPDPTRPDPTEVPDGTSSPSGSAGKPRPRSNQLPDDWQPHDNHRSFATGHDLDLATESAQFVDHHKARGTRMVDWDRAFWTWLRNAIRFRDQAGGNGHKASGQGKPGWFEPFSPGPAPREVEDDPEKYAAWLETRRAEHRARQAP